MKRSRSWVIVLGLMTATANHIWAGEQGAVADALVKSIRTGLAERRITTVEEDRAAAVPVERYRRLVRKATWTEVWPEGDGEKTLAVTAEIWSAAIQAALDQHPAVLIPARREPYYLDAPLVLKSGRRLLADPVAEIRLKPSTGTCMLRNEHPLTAEDRPVEIGSQADRDLVVAGGVWSTLATSRKQTNGNVRGTAGNAVKIPGAFGVMLFNHVDGLVIRDVTIKQGKPFGIQLSLVRNFLIERIRFVDHRCDGIHLNGPASDGIIRSVGGVTYDDLVALNAWDWRGSAMSFGTIQRLWLSDIQGTLRARPTPKSPWPPSDGTSQMRLLAGTKHYPGGQRLDCDIRDCVFDRLGGLRTIKMYDQPNLGCRDRDYADPIGRMANLHFRDIQVYRYIAKPLFEIGSNIDRMSVANVLLHFDLSQSPFDRYRLIEIGPKSDTLKRDPKDPRTWIEIYSPDKDCTVRNLRLTDCRHLANAAAQPLEVAGDSLVRVFSQTPNPDYPNTTPKGGTGKGHWIK